MFGKAKGRNRIREQLKALEGGMVKVKMTTRDHSGGITAVGRLSRATDNSDDWWQTRASSEEQPYRGGAAFHVDCVKSIDMSLGCIRLKCTLRGL